MTTQGEILFDLVNNRQTLDKQRTACLIVGVYQGGGLSPSAQAIDKVSGKQLSKLIRSADIQGGLGQTSLLHEVAGVGAKRVLLVGFGAKDDTSPASYRYMVRQSISALPANAADTILSCVAEFNLKGCDKAWKIKQAVIGAGEVLYRFNQCKSRPKPKPNLRKISFSTAEATISSKLKQALNEGCAVNAGVAHARDLANLPANICTPRYLADQARQLAKKYKALNSKILTEMQLKQQKMGSFLSVAQGSSEPPRLIVLQYNGGAKNARPVVLIGKGVTFDTGGISIKPSAAMDEMKFDMCGAAAVLGTLKTVAMLGLPINVVGIVPATENMPGGRAVKPGDVVTSMSGQTVEILNTDAEGRLILCDALTYCQRFKPEVVIDIATLTGACVIALGKHPSGLLGNDDGLVTALLKAGQISGDRAWQLPLWEEYQEQLNSPFADMANIGGREAGTITAACFLARFTEAYRWAHLDIAGTAWRSGKNKGATGRPVGLLTEYIIGGCK